MFPLCFLLLWVFLLIAEDFSPERIEVSPSCGKSESSYRITLRLSHAKSTASLSTQTYIPPLPATTAVAAGQWAEATEVLPCHPSREQGQGLLLWLIETSAMITQPISFFNFPKDLFFYYYSLICCSSAAIYSSFVADPSSPHMKLDSDLWTWTPQMLFCWQCRSVGRSPLWFWLKYLNSMDCITFCTDNHGSLEMYPRYF